MRTITLELLRHGPPNNQLLSPLTRYLALCGNRPAITVNVPFEHAEFLAKLRALRYTENHASRELHLDETARRLADMLGLPGFVCELSGAADSALTHVRLIISANELALLPFELANSPTGTPGAGLPLGLQTDNRVCMTREIRRIETGQYEWPDKPAILFAFASPPALAPLPHEAHLLALRHAVDPWLFHTETEDARFKEATRHLEILPYATLERLAERCAKRKFSHVHILAHGVPYDDGVDRRYGLAFHDERDPQALRPVAGTEVATAIRAPRRSLTGDLACPTVVTVASCDGGNIGTVYGAGASVAHALHESGIPLVIASQFPLSMTGSVRMVETLYEGFLAGADPRVLLDTLRRRLKTTGPKTHDWASIVAYAALPHDFDERLVRHRVRRSRAKIIAAFNHADGRVNVMNVGSKLSDDDKKSMDTDIERTLKRLEQAKKELTELLEFSPQDAAIIHGFLASAEKKEAETRYRLWLALTRNDQETGMKTQAAELRKIRMQLTAASRHYARVFELDRSHSWPLVQRLVLDWIPNRRVDTAAWVTARTLALMNAERDTISDAKARIWAFSDLVELHVIALLDTRLDKNGEDDDVAAQLFDACLHDVRKTAHSRAARYANKIMEMRRVHEVDIDPLRKQMRRYRAPDGVFQVADASRETECLAEAILDILSTR